MTKGVKGSTPTRPCKACGKPCGGRQPARYCSDTCRALKWAQNAVDGFWAKVNKAAGPMGCWVYTGFRKWDGYGWLQRHVGGIPRSLTAHRYAWILTHGEPPAGAHIMHKCDNPPCCNPAHLQLGTHDENMKDMAAKGRQNSGYTKRIKPVLYPDRVRPGRRMS